MVGVRFLFGEAVYINVRGNGDDTLYNGLRAHTLEPCQIDRCHCQKIPRINLCNATDTRQALVKEWA